MSPSGHSIRVLIVAGGEVRRLLSGALRSAGLAVVDASEASTEIVAACQEAQPEVVVVDAGLPERAGFSAIEDIMAYRPTPILVLADSQNSAAGFEALSMGALDVLALPAFGEEADFRQQLARRLKLLRGVRVIQHVRGRHAKKRPVKTGLGGPPVVGIAASLGGPRALANLLRDLPRDLPAPMVVVQHISDGFSTGLASWLAGESGLEVLEAQDRQPLRPGVVLVAPTGAHLKVCGDDQIELDRGPAVGGFRPSATVMFDSLAHRYGPRVVGVVLTGMGRDGADGLLAVRGAGGRTLAQDESSSVVYGMPKAAVEAGAVEAVFPLEELPDAIDERVRELNALWLRGRA